MNREQAFASGFAKEAQARRYSDSGPQGANPEEDYGRNRPTFTSSSPDKDEKTLKDEIVEETLNAPFREQATAAGSLAGATLGGAYGLTNPLKARGIMGRTGQIGAGLFGGSLIGGYGAQSLYDLIAGGSEKEAAAVDGDIRKFVKNQLGKDDFDGIIEGNPAEDGMKDLKKSLNLGTIGPKGDS